MKVLLITPPGQWLYTYNPVTNPIGLLYLAAVLLREGRHEVEVLDCWARRVSHR